MRNGGKIIETTIKRQSTSRCIAMSISFIAVITAFLPEIKEFIETYIISTNTITFGLTSDLTKVLIFLSLVFAFNPFVVHKKNLYLQSIMVMNFIIIYYYIGIILLIGIATIYFIFKFRDNEEGGLFDWFLGEFIDAIPDEIGD